MFILLCGYPPFYGEDERSVTASICSSEEVELDAEDWEHVALIKLKIFFAHLLEYALRCGAVRQLWQI